MMAKVDAGSYVDVRWRGVALDVFGNPDLSPRQRSHGMATRVQRRHSLSKPSGTATTGGDGICVFETPPACCFRGGV